MERDVEALVDGKVNVCQQCPLAVKRQTVPGGGTSGPHCQPSEGRACPAVLCAVWPHPEHCM